MSISEERKKKIAQLVSEMTHLKKPDDPVTADGHEEGVDKAGDAITAGPKNTLSCFSYKRINMDMRDQAKFAYAAKLDKKRLTDMATANGWSDEHIRRVLEKRERRRAMYSEPAPGN